MKFPDQESHKAKTNPIINTFGITGLMFLGAVLFAGANAWLYIPAIVFIVLGQGLQIQQQKQDRE